MKLAIILIACLAFSATVRAADAPKTDAPKTDAPKPEAPKDPKPDALKPPAKPGPESSGLEVIIKSAKVDFIGLRKPLPGGGFDDFTSDQKLLLITLTITNKGQKEITYKSFNGTADGKDDRAALYTTTKKFLPLANFGEFEVAEALKQATLKPGDSVTDLLAFMAPPADIKVDVLMLPAKNHGDPGYWKLPLKIEEEPK